MTNCQISFFFSFFFTTWQLFDVAYKQTQKGYRQRQEETAMQICRRKDRQIDTHATHTNMHTNTHTHTHTHKKTESAIIILDTNRQLTKYAIKDHPSQRVAGGGWACYPLTRQREEAIEPTGNPGKEGSNCIMLGCYWIVEPQQDMKSPLNFVRPDTQTNGNGRWVEGRRRRGVRHSMRIWGGGTKGWQLMVIQVWRAAVWIVVAGG